ncbi:unnamed protein product [Ectocarpus sp. 8 AP-2014]
MASVSPLLSLPPLAKQQQQYSIGHTLPSPSSPLACLLPPLPISRRQQTYQAVTSSGRQREQPCSKHITPPPQFSSSQTQTVTPPCKTRKITETSTTKTRYEVPKNIHFRTNFAGKRGKYSKLQLTNTQRQIACILRRASWYHITPSP